MERLSSGLHISIKDGRADSVLMEQVLDAEELVISDLSGIFFWKSSYFTTPEKMKSKSQLLQYFNSERKTDRMTAKLFA